MLRVKLIFAKTRSVNSIYKINKFLPNVETVVRNLYKYRCMFNKDTCYNFNEIQRHKR